MDLYAFTLIYMYIYGFTVISYSLIDVANSNTVHSRSRQRGEAIEERGSTPKYSNLACRQICCTSIVLLLGPEYAEGPNKQGLENFSR